MTTDTEALIEALERAEGPSKETDRQIARLAGWHRVEPHHTRGKHGGWIAPQDWLGANSDGSPILDSLHGTTIHREVPGFTASIDAALTLVPEGTHVSAQFDTPEPGSDTAASFVLSYGEKRLGAALARTPALALCAAALRADTREDTP